VSETMADADAWLIIKHGLYYKPGSHGYTGVRDLAGRFSKREAEYHANANDEIRIVPLLEADEFSKSCWDDVARDHLTKQRAAKDAEIASLRAQLDEAKEAVKFASESVAGLARTAADLRSELDEARRKAIEQCAAIAKTYGGDCDLMISEFRALLSESKT